MGNIRYSSGREEETEDAESLFSCPSVLDFWESCIVSYTTYAVWNEHKGFIHFIIRRRSSVCFYIIYLYLYFRKTYWMSLIKLTLDHCGFIKFIPLIIRQFCWSSVGQMTSADGSVSLSVTVMTQIEAMWPASSAPGLYNEHHHFYASASNNLSHIVTVCCKMRPEHNIFLLFSCMF